MFRYMDSTPNNSDEINPDNNPPMTHHELITFTVERYRKRFDDLMVWINDVEKKSAALIAANGVVLALSATLISNFSNISQHIADSIVLCSNTILFFIYSIIQTIQPGVSINGIYLALSPALINNFGSIPQYIVHDTIFYLFCVLAYAIQLILFVGSMISAYCGYNISTYTVPEISYLCEESLKDDVQISKTDLLLRELAELKNSKANLDILLKNKADYVKVSQLLFILGCLILAILLFLFAIAP